MTHATLTAATADQTTTTNPFYVRIWDGETSQFETHDEAMSWLMYKLEDWMNDGDTLSVNNITPPLCSGNKTILDEVIVYDRANLMDTDARGFIYQWVPESENDMFVGNRTTDKNKL